MGLQLSVLVGCVGALELLACLRHVLVCVLKATDQPSSCCIDYFHRGNKLTSDGFVILDKSHLDDEEEKQVCSEIEAILRSNRAEPNILCIGGPAPAADGYVRIPTPIPFGVDDEEVGRKSSSPASSLIDSGNENPTTRKSIENLSVKRYNGSSSDVSSLEETEGNVTKSTSKKHLRRSRTPDAVYKGSCEDYGNGEEEEPDNPRKHQKSSALASRRSARSKSKNAELGRSMENLASVRRSKRHREPERCKSDIQFQPVRNPLRDEWTNTSPRESEANLSRASSKRSISVLIQTSFEDKLRHPENNALDESNKLNPCPNCCCGESRVRQVTESGLADGKPQLVKISSFEEASGDDYDKLKRAIDGSTGRRSWTEGESFDEYVDAEDEGLTFGGQPIQFNIPDPGDSQSFWVTGTTHTNPVFLFLTTL